MSELNDFFSTFNIEPNDDRLYIRALTHRSYIHQRRKNKREDQQERLEFFGDAVLKFVVSLLFNAPVSKYGRRHVNKNTRTFNFRSFVGKFGIDHGLGSVCLESG